MRRRHGCEESTGDTGKRWIMDMRQVRMYVHIHTTVPYKRVNTKETSLYAKKAQVLQSRKKSKDLLIKI